MGYFNNYITKSYSGFSQDEEEDEVTTNIQPERGFLGDTATGLLRGGNELIASTGRIGEAMGISNEVEDRAEERRQESKWLAPDVSEVTGEEGFIKSSYMGALEAAPSSVVPGAIGGVAGFLVGGPAGAIYGAGLGAGGFAGGSEGRAAYERGIDEGMSEGEAFGFGVAQGVTSGSLEGLAMGIDVLTAGGGKVATSALRSTVNGILSRGPKQLTKDISRIYGTTILAENVTEQAQLEAAAAIDRKYGLKGEVTWEERAETVGTTTMLSLMFGTVAASYNVTERSKIKSDLNSNDPTRRAKGIAELQGRLEKQGETELSTQVGELNPNIPVNIDENIVKNANRAKGFAGTEAGTVDSAGKIIDRTVQEIATEEYSPELPTGSKVQEAILATPSEKTNQVIDEVLGQAGIPTAPVAGTSNVIAELKEQAEATPKEEVPMGPNEQAVIETQKATLATSVSPETVAPQETPEVAAQPTVTSQAIPEVQSTPASTQQAPTAPNVLAPGSEANPEVAPGITKGDVEEAADVVRRSQGQGVAGVEETPSPAEVMEATQVLKQAGYDPQDIPTQEVGGTTERVQGLASKAKSTHEAAMILGELESEELRDYVDTELAKVPTTRTNTSEGKADVIREILSKIAGETVDPIAQQEILNNIEPYVESYKGKSKVKTVGGQVTWTYDEEGDFHMGTGLDGEAYWITKTGKGKHVLTKGNETIGTFNSPESAKQHLSGSGKGKIVGTPEEVKATKAKVAKVKETTEAEGYALEGKGKAWTVTHKGSPVNKVKLRSKGRAKAFQKMHNENPKLKVGNVVSDLNSLPNQTAINEYVANGGKVKGEPTITEKVAKKAIERKARIAKTKAENAKALKAKEAANKIAKEKKEAKKKASEKRRAEGKTLKQKAIQKKADELMSSGIYGDNVVGATKDFDGMFTKIAGKLMGILPGFKGKTLILIDKDFSTKWLQTLKDNYEIIAAVDLPSDVKQDITRAAMEGETTGSFGFYYPPSTRASSSGVVYLKSTISNTKNRPSKTASNITVMAHEIGHMFMRERFKDMSNTEKMALYKEWKIHQEKMDSELYASSYSEFVKMTRGYYRWKEESSHQQGPAIDAGERHLEYLMSFNEWFADQVAKWATTDAKPMNAIEQLFKDVADIFDKILSVIIQPNASQAGNMVTSPVMRAFLNGQDFVAVANETYGKPNPTSPAQTYNNYVQKDVWKQLFGNISEIQSDTQRYFDEDYQGVDIDSIDDMLSTSSVPKPKTVGNLTMLSDDKSILKEVGVFKGLLSEFGINSPQVYVAESGDLDKNFSDRYSSAPEWLQDLMVNRRSLGGFKDVQGMTEYNQETNELFILVNKETLKDKSKEARYELMAHEAGHILEMVMFHSAPQETQQDILDAWRKEAKDNIVSSETVGDLIRNARARHIGMETLTKGQIAQVKDFNLDMMDSNNIMDYTSFQEWWADQVSKWVGTEGAPKSLSDKFFKGLANVYKKIVAKLRGEDLWYDLPNKEVESFLNDKLENIRQAKEAGFLYDPISDMLDPGDLYMAEEYLRQESIDMVFGEDGLQMDSPMAVTPSEKAKLAASEGIIAYSTEEARSIFETLSNPKNKVWQGAKRFAKRAQEETRKALVSGIDTLNRVSPELGRAMTNYARKISERNAKFKKDIEGFTKSYNALSKAKKLEFDMHLFNGDRERIARDFPEMKESMEQVDQILEKIRRETERRGAMPSKDVKNYFPRKVSDNLGLQRLLSSNDRMGVIEQEIAQAERKKGSSLSEQEREELVNQMLRTGRYYGSFSTPGSLKERAINKVDPHMMQHYSSSLEAIYDHMYQMNEFIERQDLIGSKGRMTLIRKVQALQKKLERKLSVKERAKLVSDLDDTMSRLSDDAPNSEMEVSLASKMEKYFVGEGKGEDFDKAMGIVRARLLEKGMHGTMNTVRNLGLISTLSDFTALITQGSEILLNIYENGPKNALLSVFTKAELKAEMFDLKAQQMEWQREGSAKWVGNVLKWSGFSGVDIKMKESFMQASLMTAREQIKKNSKRFKNNFEPMFKGDTDQLIKDLKDGTNSDLVREYAFAKLMNYQPLDVIANPQAYATGGNLRILYMLKTFSIRQANAVYREGIHGIIYGDKKEKLAALGRLTALSALIIIGGATKDELRDFWLGREVPMSEQLWDNALNVIMLSRYDTDRFATEGIGKQAFGKLAPASPWLDYPYKDLVKWMDGGDKAPQTINLIPIVGKTIYNRWTTTGRTKEYDKRKKNLRKRIKADVEGNKRVSPETRRLINEYNRKVDRKDRMTTSSVSRTVSDIKRKQREN